MVTSLLFRLNHDPLPLPGIFTSSHSPFYTYTAFLATDCIGTEKLVSGEYNTNVFAFGNTEVRKLLADIQVEEQNHAEMLSKYKMVNGMK